MVRGIGDGGSAAGGGRRGSEGVGRGRRTRWQDIFFIHFSSFSFLFHHCVLLIILLHAVGTAMMSLPAGNRLVAVHAFLLNKNRNASECKRGIEEKTRVSNGEASPNPAHCRSLPLVCLHAFRPPSSASSLRFSIQPFSPLSSHRNCQISWRMCAFSQCLAHIAADVNEDCGWNALCTAAPLHFSRRLLQSPWRWRPAEEKETTQKRWQK